MACVGVKVSPGASSHVTPVDNRKKIVWKHFFSLGYLLVHLLSPHKRGGRAEETEFWQMIDHFGLCNVLDMCTSSRRGLLALVATATCAIGQGVEGGSLSMHEFALYKETVEQAMMEALPHIEKTAGFQAGPESEHGCEDGTVLLSAASEQLRSAVETSRAFTGVVEKFSVHSTLGQFQDALRGVCGLMQCNHKSALDVVNAVHAHAHSLIQNGVPALVLGQHVASKARYLAIVGGQLRHMSNTANISDLEDREEFWSSGFTTFFTDPQDRPEVDHYENMLQSAGVSLAHEHGLGSMRPSMTRTSWRKMRTQPDTCIELAGASEMFGYGKAFAVPSCGNC